jgi:hypothetical protein
MNSKKLSFFLLALVFFILAFVTLVPNSSERIVSHLGYRSVCPFAPYSTLTLFIMSGGFYLLGRRTGN